MLKDRLHTKQNKKTSKKTILVLVLVLVVLCAAAGFFVWQKNKSDSQDKTDTSSEVRPRNTVDYSPSDKDDNKTIEDAKSNPSKEPTTIDNRTTNPSGTVDFSVTVTGANTDNANKLVRVSTLVNGASSGTCTLSFSKSGQPNVTATNQVELQNNSYVCPNFSIPFSQFPSGGEWNVSVSVNSNSKTSVGKWQGGPITINK
jgi:flagellar basal body-associated protein FliL